MEREKKREKKDSDSFDFCLVTGVGLDEVCKQMRQRGMGILKFRRNSHASPFPDDLLKY